MSAIALAPRPLTRVWRIATRSRQLQVVRCNASIVSSVRDAVASRQRSAVEVAQEWLDRAQSVEGQVNSFLALDAEGALAAAAAVDARLAAGDPAGALAGVPLAIKDNICTAGLATTAGSKQLAGYMPPFDATAVARLRAAGAVLIGKANMDEFGMGSSTENSSFGPTRNPWDLARVPGGSSGGSAAAVAAHQVAAALGSDTGGSIRQPASFCGCVGLKPTYGRVSRYGLVAYASSLDCIGPLATSVADAAALLGVIAGHDAADSTSSARPAEDYVSALLALGALPSAPLAGRRLAVITETMGKGVDVGVAAALEGAVAHLRGLGAEVDEVSLPSFAFGLPAYYVIALSEASSNLSRYDGVRYGARSLEAGGEAPVGRLVPAAASTEMPLPCPCRPQICSLSVLQNCVRCMPPRARRVWETRSSAASSWAPTLSVLATTTHTTSVHSRCASQAGCGLQICSRKSLHRQVICRCSCS